ncbi:alpha/beta hydrolase [Williamsia soli]|uniref:alpha/beta hydrolase n=1 Tax=Williamsia soli TaxID=364929 RepID=UPI0027DB28ED|nr:alpha/beta hydrolase family protein [Williamsia soli]
MRRQLSVIVTAVILCVICELGVLSTASADPAGRELVEPAEMRAMVMATPHRAELTVFSHAMRRAVRVDVLLPAKPGPSAKRPTLYMLDGIDAGVYSGYTESGWTQYTDIVDFMADKNVNVVLPIGGTGSYYTDWQRDDPALGRNKWETFLVEELPPLIDATFQGNGRNAVEGLSMGATGAMMLAVRNPDLYAGAALLSGCLDLGDPAAQNATTGSVRTRGGEPENMWGSVYNKTWEAHDPGVNIAALRGKPLYVAVGNGLPDPALGLAGLASPVGGVLEAAALACTQSFEAKADAAGVEITFDYREGLHSWGYWNEDLHRSWPTIAEALDI